MYRGFDSIEEIEALRADIDMCLKEKMFLKGKTYRQPRPKRFDRRRHNPMINTCETFLKRNIKEVFKPETSNALHDEKDMDHIKIQKF